MKKRTIIATKEGNEMVAEAYYEGYWMALDGHDRESNPYSEAIRRHSWDEGWEDAQEEWRVSDR
jgi:ribosome modulation factor